VPGTANELEQVLLNLLKNAAQAIHQRAAQRAGAHHPAHPAQPALGGNPGRGQRRRHARSVRKRTFEPFFTTKEIGQGTGLGLSVSYFIITNNHKGQMEVQSTPGQGTCFTLRLPLGQPATTNTET
jgi:signal transduction histidine kinase